MLGMDEEAVWILDRMYECSSVRPTFECMGLVSQALSTAGHYAESWEMLQVCKEKQQVDGFIHSLPFLLLMLLSGSENGLGI